MNISVKGEYAVQAIFDLALQKPGEPVRISGIARRRKIPQKFLELILASLKQGGFVESRRGAGGGYLLARTPREITVGQVVRFVEGARGRSYALRRKGDHALCDLWRRMDEAASEVLDGTTYADLVRAWREKHERYVPNWEI